MWPVREKHNVISGFCDNEFINFGAAALEITFARGSEKEFMGSFSTQRKSISSALHSIIAKTKISPVSFPIYCFWNNFQVMEGENGFNILSIFVFIV